MSAALKEYAFYVVELTHVVPRRPNARRREVWQYVPDHDGGKGWWYRPGDEELCPFDWASKVIRQVKL